jgi:hypothetical protein
LGVRFGFSHEIGLQFRSGSAYRIFVCPYFLAPYFWPRIFCKQGGVHIECRGHPGGSQQGYVKPVVLGHARAAFDWDPRRGIRHEILIGALAASASLHAATFEQPLAL